MEVHVQFALQILHLHILIEDDLLELLLYWVHDPSHPLITIQLILKIAELHQKYKIGAVAGLGTADYVAVEHCDDSFRDVEAEADSPCIDLFARFQEPK